jgi:hypothetical protein
VTRWCQRSPFPPRLAGFGPSPSMQTKTILDDDRCLDGCSRFLEESIDGDYLPANRAENMRMHKSFVGMSTWLQHCPQRSAIILIRNIGSDNNTKQLTTSWKSICLELSTNYQRGKYDELGRQLWCWSSNRRLALAQKWRCFERRFASTAMELSTLNEAVKDNRQFVGVSISIVGRVIWWT